MEAYILKAISSKLHPAYLWHTISFSELLLNALIEDIVSLLEGL